jgi:hypothetical protein
MADTTVASWATETEASAVTSAITPAARQAFYVGVVHKVNSILGATTMSAADMSEVNRTYQGGVMKIPFGPVDRITSSQMMSIERELTYVNGSVRVENSDVSGTVLIVTVDLKKAIENGRRLQLLRQSAGSNGGGRVWLVPFLIVAIAAVAFAFFAIPAQTKIDLVRTYIPLAERGFLRMSEMLRGVPQMPSSVDGA